MRGTSVLQTTVAQALHDELHHRAHRRELSTRDFRLRALVRSRWVSAATLIAYINGTGARRRCIRAAALAVHRCLCCSTRSLVADRADGRRVMCARTLSDARGQPSTICQLPAPPECPREVHPRSVPCSASGACGSSRASAADSALARGPRRVAYHSVHLGAARAPIQTS